MSVSAACYSRMLRCLLNAQTTEGTYIWIGNQVAANATVLYPETMHWPLQGATLINHLTLRNQSCPLFRTFATDSHRSAGQSYRLQQKTLNASHATPTCYNHTASGARYAEETYIYRRRNSEQPRWSDLIFIPLPALKAEIKKCKIVSPKKNN